MGWKMGSARILRRIFSVRGGESVSGYLTGYLPSRAYAVATRRFGRQGGQGRTLPRIRLQRAGDFGVRVGRSELYEWQFSAFAVRPQIGSVPPHLVAHSLNSPEATDAIDEFRPSVVVLTPIIRRDQLPFGNLTAG